MNSQQVVEARLENTVHMLHRMRAKYNDCIIQLIDNDLRFNTLESRRIKHFLHLLLDEVTRDWYTVRTGKLTPEASQQTNQQITRLWDALALLNYQEWTGETLFDQQLGTQLQTIHEEHLQQLHATIHQTT